MVAYARFDIHMLHQWVVDGEEIDLVYSHPLVGLVYQLLKSIVQRDVNHSFALGGVSSTWLKAIDGPVNIRGKLKSPSNHMFVMNRNFF